MAACADARKAGCDGVGLLRSEFLYMERDLYFVPALLGMGLDEFSISATKITKVRKLLSELSYAECRAHTDRLLTAVTIDEVKALLEDTLPEKYRNGGLV